MEQRKSLGDVVLVHWNANEAQDLAAPLRSSGWRVRLGCGDFKALKANPPAAVLISLRRLPSHGRQVADALWHAKWGREIPIVFFDGEPDKVEATRRQFPTARYAAWEDLPSLLAECKGALPDAE